MSRLFLMRHGEAEFSASHDEMRRLTDRGLQQVRQAASRLPGSPIALYHSPYVRAVESANAVAETCKVSSHNAASWLVPDASVDAALAQLDVLSGQDTLLVTHNPFVSTLAAVLSGEPLAAVTFETGALAELQGIDSDAWLPACLAFRWL